MMARSDLMVRQARAADKTYNLPDTDDLGLVVAPTGGKSWHLRYYWLGKQKRISLGNYPEISLREARALRDEARALLAKGITPHLDRKQKRHAVKLASDFTFKAVYDAWVEHRSKELKTGRNSTLSQIKRIFGKDVLPTLGKMSIYDIRRPQLLGVLARIEKRKAGQLPSISLGNRGQRVPDWQLVPLKHKLAQVLMAQCPYADSWELYRMLTRPHPDLGDRAAIDVVTATNVPAVVRAIMGTHQPHAGTHETAESPSVPEQVQQRIRRMMEDTVVVAG